MYLKGVTRGYSPFLTTFLSLPKYQRIETFVYQQPFSFLNALKSIATEKKTGVEVVVVVGGETRRATLQSHGQMGREGETGVG